MNWSQFAPSSLGPMVSHLFSLFDVFVQELSFIYVCMSVSRCVVTMSFWVNHFSLGDEIKENDDNIVGKEKNLWHHLQWPWWK